MSSAQHPAAFMNLQNALNPFGRSQAPAFSNLMREQISAGGLRVANCRFANSQQSNDRAKAGSARTLRASQRSARN
jgi:hypothetical protein